MVCVCAHVCVCMRVWLVSFDITLLKNSYMYIFNDTLRRCINKLVVQNRNQNSTSTPHYDNADS